MGRISRTRNPRSLRRRPGDKPPRSITLIVCEGETEQQYFEAARICFGLSRAEVVLPDDTDGAAPISVVNFAERKCREAGGYDQVFCVFDRDGHESFERALAKVSGLASRKRGPLPIKAIVSVPCFEIWVLLHFEPTDAPFANCKAVIARVRSHLPGYVKADAATSRELLEHLGQAIANAEWLDGRAEEMHSNPSTNVHHVLRHLAQVAQPE